MRALKVFGVTGAGAALATMIVGPAIAQAWIGQVVGQAAARGAEAQRLRDCLSQSGGARINWEREGPKIDETMAAFIEAATDRDAKTVRSTYSTRKIRGVKGVDGAVMEPEAFRPPADAPLARIGLVLEPAGNGAHGVWVQEQGEPARPTFQYIANLERTLGGRWRITRMIVNQTLDYPAPEPGRVCTPGTLGPLW